MTTEQTSPPRKFDVVKVYLKDVSFESPLSPVVFTRTDLAPKIDVQLQVHHQRIESERPFYEVVLRVCATATEDEKAVFLVEVQQAGIFEITGVAEADMPVALKVACPNVLLPFAREAIADLATKGGFPQLLINPFNFEHLYRQPTEAPATAPDADADSIH